MILHWEETQSCILALGIPESSVGTLSAIEQPVNELVCIGLPAQLCGHLPLKRWLNRRQYNDGTKLLLLKLMNCWNA